MSSTDSTSAPAFLPPNYTQTPNEFFDELLPEIDSMAELKVTLAIIRQTFGWHKVEDKLSLTQLVELTGMHKETVSIGIQAALKRGYVGRRKAGRGYLYGLRVKGRNIRPSNSQEFRPTKERVKEKENVEANASSGKPQSVSLEKYVVDEIYAAMKAAKLRLPNSDFTYHLGRAKDMLEKDEPTDGELDHLPASFVRLWKIRGKADAPAALMEMRRQQARVEVLANDEPPRLSASQRKAGYEWLFDEKDEKRDLDAELEDWRNSA